MTRNDVFKYIASLARQNRRLCPVDWAIPDFAARYAGALWDIRNEDEIARDHRLRVSFRNYVKAVEDTIGCLSQEVEQEERDQLARLKAKYEPTHKKA